MKLSVRGGGFAYKPQKPVFNDISFTMNSGDILSILGPNGSGKTTLLKCIVGILELNHGEVILDGRVLSSGKERGSFFGYVPQLIGTPPAYSVFQMVLLGRSRFFGTFSKPSSHDYGVAERAIAQVGIEHLSERSFNHLSGGERQLVLIARALVQESTVLVFDEPTAALDLQNQHSTVELMRRLAHEQGFSILFSTHTPSHALHISDQTVLIGSPCHGCVAGCTTDVITEHRLCETFGVEAKIMRIVQPDGSVSMGVLPVLQSFTPRSSQQQRYETPTI